MSAERIINIVANDMEYDAIKRLAHLSQEATSCQRSLEEPIFLYIERFLRSAQFFLILVIVNKKSVESHNLALIFINSRIILLSNSSLLLQLFSSMMSSFVSAKKHKVSNSFRNIPFSIDKAKKTTDIF